MGTFSGSRDRLGWCRPSGWKAMAGVRGGFATCREGRREQFSEDARGHVLGRAHSRFPRGHHRPATRRRGVDRAGLRCRGAVPSGPEALQRGPVHHPPGGSGDDHRPARGDRRGRPRCRPTTRPPAWPGSAAKRTPGYSATACAPGLQTLADSFTGFIGHPAYNTDTLRADLHRFAFLLGASDGEETLRRADPMITNCALTHPPLDKITRITNRGGLTVASAERLVTRRSASSELGNGVVATSGLVGHQSSGKAVARPGPQMNVLMPGLRNAGSTSRAEY
jgi:hypothetical protein